MIQLYFLLIGVTITWSKPSPRWRDDQIVFYSQDVGRSDGYSFKFQTKQGNYRNERAVLRTNSKGIKYLEVVGSFSYMDDTGNRHSVAYKSDDKGYRLVKPVEPVEGDNEKLGSRFQPIIDDTNEKIIISQNSDRPSQIGPKYTSIETSDETLNIGERNNTKAEEGVDNNITEHEVTEGLTTIILSTTVASVSPTNDTLLKVSDKTQNGAQYDEEGVGNRVGLPPGLIGSLLGGGG